MLKLSQSFRFRLSTIYTFGFICIKVIIKDLSKYISFSYHIYTSPTISSLFSRFIFRVFFTLHLKCGWLRLCLRRELKKISNYSKSFNSEFFSDILQILGSILDRFSVPCNCLNNKQFWFGFIFGLFENRSFSVSNSWSAVLKDDCTTIIVVKKTWFL